MGKTYEALKKAEAEQQKSHKPPLELGVALSEARSPDVQWDDMGSHTLTEYQKIRVWLNQPATAARRRVQTVLVVGCYSGQGSTTTASLLAATLAEGHKSRVLIIDGNFRTPSLNMVFKVKNNGGFTASVSSGEPFETCIQATDRPNLFVLTSGKVSNVSVEVYEGRPIDELIAHFKLQFDFIVFDGAPLLEFPDSYALAPKVDCVILVVEAERTTIEAAQEAKRNLEQTGANILGVVMNRQKTVVPALVRKFLGAQF